MVFLFSLESNEVHRGYAKAEDTLSVQSKNTGQMLPRFHLSRSVEGFLSQDIVRSVVPVFPDSKVVRVLRFVRKIYFQMQSEILALEILPNVVLGNCDNASGMTLYGLAPTAIMHN